MGRVTAFRRRGRMTPDTTEADDMDKYEYFSGIPEVGIVPRAPPVGPPPPRASRRRRGPGGSPRRPAPPLAPALQHVHEQEHGRGVFAGKVTHTYHLYPPNNWLPGETGTLPGFPPPGEWANHAVGGAHHPPSAAR